MTPNIPLIAWSPDGDPTRSGVMVDVENMVPTQRGYAAEFILAPPSTWTVTLPGECYGIAGLTYQYASPALYFGTGSDLHYSTGSGYTTVTRSAGAYTAVSSGTPWRFAAFRDATIAVQANNATQSTPAHGSLFSDISGAPRAGTIATQRNFVIVGEITDSVSYKPDGWACCALEDYLNWTPDIATQAATGRLTATQGAIVRMIAWRDYVIAFKRRGVYRGQYVGAAANTWTWPLVSAEIGLISHDAVCEADGALYWMGLDGFYRWSGALERIPDSPWNWLRSQTVGGSLPGTVQAVYDPVRRVVRWFVFGARSGYAGPWCVTYHLDTGRWGRADLPVQWAFTLPSAFVAIEGASNDAEMYSVPGYVRNVDVAVVAHVEDPVASSFTTGDIGDDDGAFAMMRARARFLTAPATSAVMHFHRMNLGDSLTTGATVSRQDGKYDLSHNARWHRLKFDQTGRCEVTGFSIDTPRAGRR